MVDVCLVVVYKTPVGTCLGCCLNVPVEFDSHRALSLLLYLGYNILHICRGNYALVVELKLTYIKLIVVVIALYAQADTLDNITACNA